MEQTATLITLAFLALWSLGWILAAIPQRWNNGRLARSLRVASTLQRRRIPTRARLNAASRARASPSTGALTSRDGAELLAMLLESTHSLVIGHTRGGKTTLLHCLASQWAELGCQVIVCDLDAANGMWPGCGVYGVGNDREAVVTGLEVVRASFQERNQARASGRQRRFAPLYVIIDEYTDVADLAREVFEQLLRRGAKLNIHLVVGVQDSRVKTLQIAGQSDLLRNFTYVVEVLVVGGQRVSRVARGSDPEANTDYVMPELPDPESFIQPAAQRDAQIEQQFDSQSSHEQGDGRIELSPTRGAAVLDATLRPDQFTSDAAVDHPSRHNLASIHAICSMDSDWTTQIAWTYTKEATEREPAIERVATNGEVLALLLERKTEASIVKELWQIDAKIGPRYGQALDAVACVRTVVLNRLAAIAMPDTSSTATYSTTSL